MKLAYDGNRIGLSLVEGEIMRQRLLLEVIKISFDWLAYVNHKVTFSVTSQFPHVCLKLKDNTWKAVIASRIVHDGCVVMTGLLRLEDS